MFEVNTKEYATMLKVHYETKTPLYAYGSPGIGKSEIPRDVFRAVATSKKRQYVEWNDMDTEMKADAFQNPENYFVFTDFRLGQCDTTDLKGIPNMSNPEMLEYMPLAWAKYYTKTGADGVIFFDEMNLAPPVVAGQAYQIINDRVISDLRIAKDVWMFGAGNKTTDKAHVFVMPFPLRDRFSEIGVSVSDEEWCSWAFENSVNPHLIAFIKWKPEALFRPAELSEDKGSTPRGVVRASRLVGSVGGNIESPMVGALVSSAVGEAFAIEFQAYVKIASKIDLKALMDNPESVQEFNGHPDKLFAICGLLGEHLPRFKPADKETALLFGVADNLPKDYCVVALNMIKSSYKSYAQFKNALLKYPNMKQLLSEVARFTL